MDHSLLDMQMAQSVAQAVAARGGRTYYVGGFVRDALMGRENKDVDIEVHGITPGCLEEILERLGEANIYGATILESKGMAHSLSEFSDLSFMMSLFTPFTKLPFPTMDSKNPSRSRSS